MAGCESKSIHQKHVLNRGWTMCSKSISHSRHNGQYIYIGGGAYKIILIAYNLHFADE